MRVKPSRLASATLRLHTAMSRARSSREYSISLSTWARSASSRARASESMSRELGHQGDGSGREATKTLLLSNSCTCAISTSERASPLQHHGNKRTATNECDALCVMYVLRAQWEWQPSASTVDRAPVNNAADARVSATAPRAVSARTGSWATLRSAHCLPVALIWHPQETACCWNARLRVSS